MIYLLLSIVSSTTILVLFKTMEKLKIDIFQVIIINYAVAFVLGILINRSAGSFEASSLFHAPWLGISMFLGVCLIAMFFVIGMSTQKAGISVTTVAGKISVVIPMLFSILYYNEPVTWLKAVGIMLALMALFCTVAKPGTEAVEKKSYYLPLILFMGLGILDVLVKFVQHEYISNTDSAAFTGASFFFAFCTGLLICLLKKVPLSRFIDTRVIITGILLGTANFGSMFFLINALNSGIFESAVLFGINSISIVGLSIFFALILFKERLSALNWVGVAMSLAAICLFIRA